MKSPIIWSPSARAGVDMTRLFFDEIVAMTDKLTDKELRELKIEINAILDIRKVRKRLQRRKKQVLILKEIQQKE